MALHGTIKDFALPEIFQLIGIQRKTGLLTLENGQDSVSVKFLEGQVVGADTHTETLEDRLGALLVRTHRIAPEQLQEALRLQKNTLQRLGYILVSHGYISEEDLVEALRVQSTQIIYRLFRWRDGTYRFIAMEDLEYDQRHFTPISSETILMEGARMIDEWPLIERRIRSPRMLLRRTAASEAATGGVGSAGVEMGFGFDRSGPDKALAALGAEDRRVLALVDGKHTVEEIGELSGLGEFDAYRILSELLRRNLLEEVRRGVEPEAGQTVWLERLTTWGAVGIVMLVSALAVATVSLNPWTPWRLLERGAAGEQLLTYAAQARLERIARALEIFYLDAGTFPADLALLAQNGYLEATDLRDAWGRPYRYVISSGGYQLTGLDEAGESIPQLQVSRTFSSVQRMVLGAAAGGAEPPPRP